jgi:hypothetical protein
MMCGRSEAFTTHSFPDRVFLKRDAMENTVCGGGRENDFSRGNDKQLTPGKQLPHNHLSLFRTIDDKDPPLIIRGELTFEFLDDVAVLKTFTGHEHLPGFPG